MDFIKGYIDITNSWLSTICKGEYKELKKGDYFYYNNVLYFIDEKNVTTNGMEEEKRFAKVLNKLYGIKITVLPRIEIPERIKTPDYYINGNEKLDLKTIKGESRRTFKNSIQKQKDKSNAYIFNVINEKLSNQLIDERIGKLFESSDVKYLKTAIFVRNNEIIKVYERKK